MDQNIEIPEAFGELFVPHRMKVYYGGRGGAKSESIARFLLSEGAKAPITILCAREFQSSIKESVHALLSSIITNHSLESFYTVKETEIVGMNGTKFIFMGLRRNIESIKSIPNIKYCWVEEAETVSDHSWNILIPTIRAENSEIILTFNPDIEDSPTYQRYVVNPPPYAYVRKVNYEENPYFPEVLRQEMEEMKAKNEALYRNVWLGECKAAVEGAIFAKEMQKAQEEGRICSVPYDKSKPVDIHFDLGRADKTALWFDQYIGFEYRLLHYYENSGEHFSHYVKVIKDLPYNIGTLYLPHDADNEQLSAQKTIKQQAIEAFPNCKVIVVQRIPQKALAIDAARAILDRCHFDRERCSDGIQCLRRYAYKVDESGKTSREPEHDTPWSHGADAFLSIGQAIIPVKKPVQKQHRSVIRRSGMVQR